MKYVYYLNHKISLYFVYGKNLAFDEKTVRTWKHENSRRNLSSIIQLVYFGTKTTHIQKYFFK